MGLFSFFRKKDSVPAAQEQKRDYAAEGLTPERMEEARASLTRWREPNPAWDAVTPEAATAAHEAYLASCRHTK